MIRARQNYKRYARSGAGNIVMLLFLIIAGGVTLLPLIYSVITSFKPLEELLVFPPQFYVLRPTMQNYLELPNIISNLAVPLSKYIFNSLFVSIVTTFLHVLVASMAAFVLSKGRFKGLGAIFMVVQALLLFNSYTLAIPQYLIFSKLDMIDTYWVYILPYLPNALGVFLIKQYMDGSVPDALIDAAYIDGASEFKIYARIIMPITRPAWMTLILFAFRDLWSLQPQGTIFDEKLKTLPTVMSTIIAGGIARTGSAMAATVILMIIPIAVYLISQSSVMETMSTSGIK